LSDAQETAETSPHLLLMMSGALARVQEKEKQ
jgi:hypothetical protein